MYDYFYGIQAEQFSFYRVPKILFIDGKFKKLSSDAKILYGIMLDRMNLSAKNGWLDEDGRVYIIYTLEECMEDMGCANQKATKLFQELEQTCGLIERKRQGMGKPNLIYVKNFASHMEESRSQIHDFHESGIMKIMNQDSRKSHTNNTNINNTDMSDTDTFLPGGGGMIDSQMILDRSAAEVFFHKQLELDSLMNDLPKDREMILGILELIIDTYCSKKKMIRVAGEEKSIEIVRGQLMKLKREHIQYVLLCLSENTTKIRGMKQYLLTMLYNAPMLIQPYYQARVNYELYGGG